MCGVVRHNRVICGVMWYSVMCCGMVQWDGRVGGRVANAVSAV